MPFRPQLLTGVLAGLLVAVGLSSPASAGTVPSAPRSVQAVAGLASATVTWKKPRSAGAAKVDRYKVTGTTPGRPKKSVKVGGAARSAVLTGLVAGVTYSFTVQAHNARGWSKASKPVTAVPTSTSTPPPPPPPPPPPAGFGTVSGPCGVVAPQLASASPTLHDNTFDFGTNPYDESDLPMLTTGTQEIYNDGNLGGSSLVSEMFAFETLARCEGASLLKTEGEIVYDDASGEKTDLLVQIGSSKVGVSVVRASSFPLDATYPQGTADTIMAGKLNDIVQSSANVSAADTWVKQVLVVMAYGDDHADKIETAWNNLALPTKANTVVYVVVTDGSDLPVYTHVPPRQ